MVELAERYTYRVSWSVEDQEFLGAVAEFPSLGWFAGDQESAFHGIRQLVTDVLADMRAAGDTAPEPIAERFYSGTFQVRIAPELHRQLVLDATE